MKKRIFYVVNLDRNRIFILAIIAAGFLGISFATGYRLAHRALSNSVALQQEMDPTTGALKPPSPGNGDVTLRSEEAPAGTDQESDQGSSIYETDRDSSTRGPRRDGGNHATGRASLDSPGGSAEETAYGSSSDRVERSSSREEISRTSREKETGKRSASKKKKDTGEKESAKGKESKREKKKGKKHEPKTTEDRETHKTKKLTRKEKEKESQGHKKDSSTGSADSERSATTDRASSSKPASGEAKKETKKQDPRSAVLDYRESSVKMANVAPSAGEKKGDTGASSATKKSSGYTLQLGAFTSQGPADRMVDTLKKRGIPAVVVHSSSHYLVRVGSAADRSGLAPLEEKLKKEHYSYMVLKK